jgi:hypothetical protein
MGTVAIIVIGLVAITVVSVIGDMVSKIAQAKIKAKGGGESAPSREIEALKERLAQLEARLEERDGAVRKLQEDVRFVSRLLEDKSSGPSAS